MILALAAVARNIKSAAENEDNAAKGLSASSGIIFYTQGMWKIAFYRYTGMLITKGGRKMERHIKVKLKTDCQNMHLACY